MKKNLFAMHGDTGSMSGLQSMNFPFEFAMSGYILENPEVLKLDDGSLSDPVILKPELPISSSSRTDIIVGYKGKGQAPGTVAIAELKNVEVNSDHLSQLVRYLNEAPSTKSPWLNNGKHVIGIIVGPSFTPEVLEAIRNGKFPDGKEHVVYGIELNRFRLDNRVLAMTEVFERKSSDKNDDHYDLVDLQMNRHSGLTKRKLVFEGVKSFLAANPSYTSSQLQSVFPKTLGWGPGDKKEVVMPVSNIPAKEDRRYHKDILTASDCQVRICGEWGEGNIGNMVGALRDLGMRVDVI